MLADQTGVSRDVAVLGGRRGRCNFLWWDGVEVSGLHTIEMQKRSWFLSFFDLLYLLILLFIPVIACGLHVAFHGCLQSYSSVSKDFVIHAGLNEWAESNNVHMLLFFFLTQTQMLHFL